MANTGYDIKKGHEIIMPGVIHSLNIKKAALKSSLFSLEYPKGLFNHFVAPLNEFGQFFPFQQSL